MYQEVSTPKVSNDLDIELTPTDKDFMGYTAFLLKIKNNTDREMEIDWNKTSFMYSGATNGTFMFEGVVYKDRNAYKSNDIIFANSTFSKKIYPNNFVEFMGRYGWTHRNTGMGEQGAYLYIIDGKEIIKEKKLLQITELKK